VARIDERDSECCLTMRSGKAERKVTKKLNSGLTGSSRAERSGCKLIIGRILSQSDEDERVTNHAAQQAHHSGCFAQKEVSI
jgi:hypothetical protein